MASPTLLFVIVGRNEPLYEAEFNKRPGAQDAATRQNYFVLHSALDLVDRAAWTTGGMYLKVVDKVRSGRCRAGCGSGDGLKPRTSLKVDGDVDLTFSID